MRPEKPSTIQPWRLCAGLLIAGFSLASFSFAPAREALPRLSHRQRGRRLIQDVQEPELQQQRRGEGGWGGNRLPASLGAPINGSTKQLPCRIHVLNATREFGIPRCVPEEHFVTRLGVIWANYDMRWWAERREHPELWAGHELSQHAGAYFVTKAIRESTYYTDDIDEADAIIVDDYCYKMWWLSNVHSALLKGQDESWRVAWRNISDVWEPHDLVRHVHASLAANPRFRRSNGAELAFFATHPVLTSFTGSNTETNSGVHALGCNEFSHSLQLVVDGVMRYTCHSHVPKQRGSFLVIPYAAPKAVHRLPSLDERHTFLFFLGGCALSVDDRTTISIGKNVRKFIVEVINQVAQNMPEEERPEISVQCTPPAPPRAHGELQSDIEHSRFCLVMVGDTASSRRLSEVVLAGCIPVLVGPPWHSLPLASQIPYASFAVFIEVQELVDHFSDTPTLEAPIPGSYALNVFDSKWWIPDLNMSAVPKSSVPYAEGILKTLLSISDSEVLERQAAMARAQRLFMYPSSAEDMPGTAAQAIIDNLCERVQKNYDLQ